MENKITPEKGMKIAVGLTDANGVLEIVRGIHTIKSVWRNGVIVTDEPSWSGNQYSQSSRNNRVWGRGKNNSSGEIIPPGKEELFEKMLADYTEAKAIKQALKTKEEEERKAQIEKERQERLALFVERSYRDIERPKDIGGFIITQVYFKERQPERKRVVEAFVTISAEHDTHYDWRSNTENPTLNLEVHAFRIISNYDQKTYRSTTSRTYNDIGPDLKVQQVLEVITDIASSTF